MRIEKFSLFFYIIISKLTDIINIIRTYIRKINLSNNYEWLNNL